MKCTLVHHFRLLVDCGKVSFHSLSRFSLGDLSLHREVACAVSPGAEELQRIK